MFGNGGGTRTIQPESLPGFRTDRDKTFGITRITQTHDFGSGQSHLLVVITNNIPDQHHFWPTVILGFAGITDGFDIAFIKMLKTGQHDPHLATFRQSRQIIPNLYNARHCFPNLTVKFQTEGTGKSRHLVQNPARRGNDTVAAFFLNTWKTTEKFVGNILAQFTLTKICTRNDQLFFGQQLAAFRVKTLQQKGDVFLIVNLA